MSEHITTYTIATTRSNKLYTINVNLTTHAQKRYKQRHIKVNKFAIAANIMAIGKEILNRTNRSIAIIDDINNISVIAEAIKVEGSDAINVDIITIIDKSDIFVRKQDTVIKLSEMF